MKVCSVQEMKEIDRRAAAAFGLADTITQENAGLAVYDVLLREVGEALRRVVIVCGTGPKGGAGLVTARRLHAHGVRTLVFVVGDPSTFHGAALAAFETARRCGVDWQGCGDREALRRALHGCSAIIDAMVEADVHDDADADVAGVIEVLNASSCPLLSIDVPSGVCGDTGRVRGSAVKARATVALGLPKRGSVTPPGSSRCGRLYVSHLTYPPALREAPEVQVALLTPSPLPERSPHGHKGTFGDTLFVAGAAGYFGAPAFSALASLRAGAGYARLACPRGIAPTLASLAPEVVFLPQDETEAGSIAHHNLDSLIGWTEKVDFTVLGPGLSLDDSTQDLVRDLVARAGSPLLVDGDGITAIAEHPNLVRDRKAPTVLTPHPGEMARLLGVSAKDVIGNPFESAFEGAKRFGAVVVLKGARTVVAHPDGHAAVNTSGNDGMGTAGSGDVLTGAIAAAHGLGLSFGEAVETGVFLHGFAGDVAMDRCGADGMTARSVLDALPEAVRLFREDFERVVRTRRWAVTVV